MFRYAIDPASGKTSYEVLTGRRTTRPIASFGEKILYMPTKTKIRNSSKAEARMKEGFWLGVQTRSDEAIIGTADGVIKSRTVRRRPADRRWDGEGLLQVRGEPRRPAPGREDEEILPEDPGTAPPRPEQEVAPRAWEPILRPEKNEAQDDKPPRSWYIREALTNKYGPTPGCPGCRAKRDRTKAQTHSQACRTRIWGCVAAEPGETARLEREEARISRHVDRAMRRALENSEELKEQERIH